MEKLFGNPEAELSEERDRRLHRMDRNQHERLTLRLDSSESFSSPDSEYQIERGGRYPSHVQCPPD
jgi:hypothetical protein